MIARNSATFRRFFCAREGAELYPRFRERIVALEQHADHIGWGYGDDLSDHVRFLEDELGQN
jgi:hypothetical protein